MSAPPQSQGEIIADKAQLVEYLEAGCKPVDAWRIGTEHEHVVALGDVGEQLVPGGDRPQPGTVRRRRIDRTAEHTSELQSPMRISLAVFCLTTKTYY